MRQGRRADPGTLINGQVAVRVYVTLSDAETPYAPISGLQLRFFRSATDSVIGRTDDAGAMTVLLSPGDYRLVSGAHDMEGRALHVEHSNHGARREWQRST